MNLNDAVGVLGVFDLTCYFTSFNVHASFKERLGVVKFVLSNIWVEFGELIIVLSSLRIILNVEIAVSEE